MKWGFIPFPRTGLICGQIGTRPEYIKWVKQALEINHFLLMRKVLHSCMPAGKESSAGRMCASPCNCLGSPMVCSILCPGHWVYPRVPLLSWVGFYFFPAAAASAEPQCCRLLTSRGWWGKTSATCVARGDSGCWSPARAAAKGGVCRQPWLMSKWGEEMPGLSEALSSSPRSGAPRICPSQSPFPSRWIHADPWPDLGTVAQA